MYLALSEISLKNVLEYEKYYHLGTYDIFITYTHELFHMVEQEKWKDLDADVKLSRVDRLEDVDARVQRNLIYKQVLQAVSEQDSIKKLQLVSAVLSSYKKYKENHTEDYQHSIFLDRIEGIAYYFELVSSMYSANAEQIKSSDDLYEGLSVIAKNLNSLDGVGLGVEGYWISG